MTCPRRAISILLLALLAEGVGIRPLRAEDRATSPARSVRRIIILRFDGLPPDLLRRYVQQRNPHTGKSYLPWIRRVFYEEGIVFEHFYTRGQSLSGPSWAMLATGQPQPLVSNVELDRATGRLEDYLNNVLIQYELLRGRRLHARVVEVLDERGASLIEDLYEPEQKRIGLELIRRGTSWTALARILQARFPHRSMEELLARWLGGFDSHEAFDMANEEHLLENLKDPRFLYLSAFYSLFDHFVHTNNDEELIRHLLQRVDRTVGRLYTAIREGPYAEETVLVLISDHGMTTRPDIYSQGFNLVNYFTRAEWGGHHVLTKRANWHDFQFRSLNFLAQGFVNPSRESPYLKGQAHYPTLFLDYDGNERAMLHFRNSDLNLLHLLLREMKRRHPERVANALRALFFEVIERNRARWDRECADVREELWAMERWMERLRHALSSLPSEQEVRRKELSVQMKNVAEYRAEYEAYLRMLSTLLALRQDSFDPRAVRPDDLIRPRVFGARNSVFQLQNYVVGLKDGTIHLRPDGRVDEEATFRRINYLRLLKEHRVLNNPQPHISPYPVDFIALRIPYEEIQTALRGTPLDTGEDVVWLYGGEDHQALIVAKPSVPGGGSRLLRYVPIARLRQTADGTITFERREFQPGFPLALWEDENLSVAGDRRAWLEEFHSEREWIEATHRTRYAIAVVGLYDLFGASWQTIPTPVPSLEHVRTVAQGGDTAAEEMLLRRFFARRRRNMEPDLLLHANPYWNFNIRDFNPGGNHGSLFRTATHATWMMWGGRRTGLKRGYLVTRPYESLSFVPTILEVMGIADGPVSGVAEAKGFRGLPGEVVWEVFDERSVAR